MEIPYQTLHTTLAKNKNKNKKAKKKTQNKTITTRRNDIRG